VNATPSYDLSEYLAIARRQWWIVILALLAGLTMGAEYHRTLAREYVSQASVLVGPAGQSLDEISIDTEAQLVRSTAVADRAATTLGLPNGDGLADAVAVEVPPKTNVLTIKFRASSAVKAQAGAQAFAQAYIADREENAKAALGAQSGSLRTRIDELNTELAAINGQLVKARQGSSAYATLDSRRVITVSQINQLAGRMSQLTAESASGGVIIREARLPGRPVRPNLPINLAAGILLGLVLGLGGAGLREHFDRRVRGRTDLVARCGVPLLGEVLDPALPADDVLAPSSPGGRAFHRLRNEILAALGPGDQVIVVTGASRGAAASHIAANLATALARTGANVVLVGAHDRAPLARLMGVAPTPGLSEVLAGRAYLGEATQRAARYPSLRVITPGGTGSAAGLLQSQALRDMVSQLRRQARYVVVEAPPTSSGADAQCLAGLADAAILAVELKRTTRPDVLDAVEQLRRVGTPVLGGVVLPELPAPVEIPAAQPVRALASSLDSKTLVPLDEAHCT
jgi:Mrp family chromosome partitioning ATPase/capsular polysaccharide biosynthesis protein